MALTSLPAKLNPYFTPPGASHYVKSGACTDIRECMYSSPLDVLGGGGSASRWPPILGPLKKKRDTLLSSFRLESECVCVIELGDGDGGGENTEKSYRKGYVCPFVIVTNKNVPEIFRNDIFLGWFYLPTAEVHLCKRFELEISNHNTSQ
jgi:hypothetical protein